VFLPPLPQKQRKIASALPPSFPSRPYPLSVPKFSPISVICRINTLRTVSSHTWDLKVFVNGTGKRRSRSSNRVPSSPPVPFFSTTRGPNHRGGNFVLTVDSIKCRMSFSVQHYLLLVPLSAAGPFSPGALRVYITLSWHRWFKGCQMSNPFPVFGPPATLGYIYSWISRHLLLYSKKFIIPLL